MMTTRAFSRMLVPVDFSTPSDRAWDLAQRLAAGLGGELLLLHVLVWEDTFTSLEPAERAAAERTRHAEGELNIGPPSSEPEIHVTPQQWADGLLARRAASPRGTGIAVRTLMRPDVPHREIVGAAREEGADLIIMGAHGRGQLERVLVGSVADRVVPMAPCRVLLVPDTAKSPA